jgi:glucose 1-dehydrogenase
MQPRSSQTNVKTGKSKRWLYSEYIICPSNNTKPHYVPYATSKAGIEMMTKTMALELARDGVRANVVAPGAIQTEMNEELKENKDELQKVLDRIPIGRIGSADEIANVVEFIASDKASYVTGTTFLVDGGMTLYPAFGSN